MSESEPQISELETKPNFEKPSEITPVESSNRHDNGYEQSEVRNGAVLWDDESCKVFAPEHPLTDRSEGIHLRVVLKSPESPFYKEDANMEKILHAFGIGMGVSKVLAESNTSGSNMWSNLQVLGEWGGKDETIIDVFGREMEHDDQGKTWAQPVVLPKSVEELRGHEGMSREEIEKFQRLFSSYLPLWNKEIKSRLSKPLFPDGLSPTQDQSAKESNEIWRGGDYWLESGKQKTHVEGGGHLVVHKRISNNRVWDDVDDALRMCALDIAASRLAVKEGFVPGNPPNINIHFSGNWALPYADRDMADPNSKVKLTDSEKEYLRNISELLSPSQQLEKNGLFRSPKHAKRAARGAKVNELGFDPEFNRLHTHGHVYWTPDGGSLVLPKNPKEANEMEHTTMPQEQYERLQARMINELSSSVISVTTNT